MSKKDKKKNQAREPWEQSIYEPDQNGGGSRLAKRQQQRGNSNSGGCEYMPCCFSAVFAQRLAAP